MDILLRARSRKQFIKACKIYRRLYGPIQDDIWVKCYSFSDFSLEKDSIYQFVQYQVFRVPRCNHDDCIGQYGFCYEYVPVAKKEVNRLIDIYMISDKNIQDSIIHLITKHSFNMEYLKIINKPLIRAAQYIPYCRREIDIVRALSAGYHEVLEFAPEFQNTKKGQICVKYRYNKRIANISSWYPNVLAKLITEYIGI